MKSLYKPILLELIFVFLFALMFVYTAFKFHHLNLNDEWLGRGLYPGLAFFNGLDFYEPKSGPHVTLYGWATGLFYVFSGFGQNPDQAAIICLSTNFLAISVVLFALFKIGFWGIQIRSLKLNLTVSGLVSLVFAFSFLEPSTVTLTQIHADTPALFFLLLSNLFLIFFLQNNKQSFLFITAFSLCISFWCKLPTLPACILPALFFAISKKWKFCLQYILHLLIAVLITISFVSFFYGLEDAKFILIDHISDNRWSDRNSLFDGKDANLLSMSYFDAIPLLFRFFVMYLEKYWFMVLASLLVIILSFSMQMKRDTKPLLRILFLGYWLTLPACIAALAHFGSVENALFFTNFFGFLCIVALLQILLTSFEAPRNNWNFVWILATLFFLPTLRTAKSIPSSLGASPHMEAFDYLQAGKNDIYFGWYPIAHLMAKGENYTSIEVPTWVGMTRPDDLSFDKKHFPPGAKYLATCKVGYGKTILQRYLGNLEEVDAPKRLSHWRLFKTTE